MQHALQKSISTTLSELGIWHIAGKLRPQRTRFRIVLSIFLKNKTKRIRSSSNFSCSDGVGNMWIINNKILTNMLMPAELHDYIVVVAELHDYIVYGS